MKLRRYAAFAAMLLLCSIAVWATNTPITTQTPVGPYPGSVSAGSLDITMTAADNVNGNSFVITGHEILLIWNTDSAAHTVTISSVADSLGRTGDVTSYSVGATTHSAFSFLGGVNGWQQPGGTVNFTANSNLIKFAVLYVTR